MKRQLLVQRMLAEIHDHWVFYYAKSLLSDDAGRLYGLIRPRGLSKQGYPSSLKKRANRCGLVLGHGLNQESQEKYPET